jgi:hypothetical protein
VIASFQTSLPAVIIDGISVYKLIGIILAAVPIVLFLKALMGQSRKRSQAVSDFKKHMDYVFWVIMLLVGCGVIYRSVNCSTSFGLAIALRAARDGANVARSLRRPGANIRHFPARSTRRQVDELAIPEIPS